MTRNIILSSWMLVAFITTSACSQQSTVPDPEPEFGQSVRNTMQSQIHDFGAALQPDTEPLEGSDSDRLNNALNAHRESVPEPQTTQQPINLSLGN